MSENGDQPLPSFDRLNVLVVEDEAIISFLIEDMLREFGCAGVTNVAGVAEALAAIAEQRPDVAVLDVNLDGEEVYPVAERLKAEGVPFVFTTGYGVDGLAPAWAHRPVVQKPFRAEMLARALSAVLATV
ncbi:Response regulator [Rhodovulum sp. PH10]|uniref:response regulator n=1 Tax=Rhodovulum sp. PH10 TaxID=1187851 RepID=UPI00027C2A1D|nr:response regulator [Rhodovulum sp. PH10]EJW12227.1 Response regulator [Rhodovulum sp. PH10]